MIDRYTTDTGSTGMTADELLDLIRRPAWWADAACRGADTDLFFPGKGGDISAALAYCNRCDVREECLAWSLEGGHTPGIFGGLSERQRRNLIRTYRRCRICGGAIPQRRVALCSSDCEAESKRRSQRASNERRGVAR